MARRVKDPVLSLQWRGFNLQSWCSGLRIRCCLGCDIGPIWGTDLIPGLGTSICCRCSQRKEKKNPNSQIDMTVLYNQNSIFSVLFSIDILSKCLRERLVTQKKVLFLPKT